MSLVLVSVVMSATRMVDTAHLLKLDSTHLYRAIGLPGADLRGAMFRAGPPTLIKGLHGRQGALAQTRLHASV